LSKKKSSQLANRFDVDCLGTSFYLSKPFIESCHCAEKRGKLSVTMSIMNPLPPQAYTKETLVQAYAWLQSQSESIKEMATTPDVLVSLFLKAKLQGNSALERPSIQNFKNELKSLAGMMGEFEVVETPESIHATGFSASSTPTSNPSGTSTYRFRSQDFKERLNEKTETLRGTPPPPPPLQSEEKISTRASLAREGLDTRSLDMIQEVKIQFNLSSDTEAMRLLIAIGYNQVTSLLK
jgi:hypothetical protein